MFRKNLNIIKKVPVPVILFFVVFVVYNLNLRTIRTLDSVPAALLPFSLINNHNLYLDQFVRYFQPPGTPPEASVYFFSYQHGHFFSSYPVILPILITPLYWVLAKLYSIAPGNLDLIMENYLFFEKIAASFITALAVVFIYILLRKITKNKKIPLVLTLIYAFATNNWASSSQALWQHGLSQLMIVLALVAFYVAKNKPRYLYLSGTFVALAVAARYNNFVFALILFIVVLYEFRKQTIRFLIPSFLLGASLLAHNLYIYGSYKGGYAPVPALANTNIVEGLSSIFFNINRGLFIYSPIIIFSFAGIIVFLKNYRKFKDHKRNVYLVALFSALLGTLFLSTVIDRSGGPVFGPRLFTDILPFFTILMVPILEYIANKPRKIKNTAITLFTFLAIFSVFVQLIGVFYYVHTDGSPGSNSSYRDWKNSQIVKLIRMEPHIRPYIDFAYRRGWIKKNKVLPPQARKANIEIKSGETNFKIGELKIYKLEITNMSHYQWPKGWDSANVRSFYVASFWVNKKGDVSRTPYFRYVVQKIAPGQKINVDCYVEAPPEAGEYVLRFDMGQEQVAQFDQPKEIKVNVSS